MTKSPSKLKYIGVWILVGIFGNIAARVISVAVYSGDRTIDDVIGSMVIGIPLEAIAIGLIIIAIYSIFSDLDMSAVYPWMIGLVTLGVIINLGILASAGFAPGWVFAYQLAITVAMLFGIRAFFRSNGRMQA